MPPGESPVLVDIDALCMSRRLTRTQRLRTFFIARASFLTRDRPACSHEQRLRQEHDRKHIWPNSEASRCWPRVTPTKIIAGFSRAWNCILGTRGRRAAFLRIVRRVRSQRRRWIYRATQGYGAVLQASTQPGPLRSMAARQALIVRSCLRRAPSRAVAEAEIKAIVRLDLPYFIRKTNHSMPADESSVPSELTEAIRSILEPSKTPGRKGG